MRCSLFVFAVLATFAASCHAELSPPATRKLYEDVSKSLVVVRYTWDSELGRRDITMPGVVMDKDGLVMTSVALFDGRIPERQMIDFKVLRPVPGQEPEELPAIYQGRDDRSAMAFVRVKNAAGLAPLAFVDHVAEVGDVVYSVGLTSESAGFKPYLLSGTVSNVACGERFTADVDGNLAAVGSPVVDAAGRGIGFVNAMMPASAAGSSGRSETSRTSAPSQFVPSHEFFDFLQAPPSGKDVPMPWLGVMEMAGLRKKEAGYYDLKVPAIQLMALVSAGPAAAAGLQPGQIVVGLDGKPLERGDSVEQIPLMLRRQLLHRSPGSQIMLSVVSEPGATPKDVPVTLGVGPVPAILADRWWNPDYGFGVRDLVMFDRVTQHMPDDAAGVIVSVVKPNTPAATANLQVNQFVSRVGGQPIHDSKDFAKKFGAWRTAHPHDAAILLVSRDGHDQTVRIEPSQAD